MHGGLLSSFRVSVAARREQFTKNLLPSPSVKEQFKDRSILREVTANVEALSLFPTDRVYSDIATKIGPKAPERHAELMRTSHANSSVTDQFLPRDATLHSAATAISPDRPSVHY